MANPMVVNAGLDIITNRLNSAGTIPQWVAIGVGIVAPVVANTTLGTAATEARVSGAVTRVLTVVANDTFQVVATIAMTATEAITESGLFDAVTTGNMLCRGTFAALNLVNGDSIQLTWKVQFTGG